jgi:D-aspartate ligase
MLSRYDAARMMIDPAEIMLQELIPGQGDCQFSFAAACDGDGNPVASILAVRRRQYPIDFGYSSSYVESIEEPEVEETARRILRALRLSGLVEIEFKRDARDGALKLLDINPRVWGWHTLGARAGVDFPYLEWRLANGFTVAETRGCPGARWIRLSTDFLCILQQIRHGRFSPREYLQSFRRPLEFGVWALSDPLPALSEVPMVLIARLKQSHHSSSGRLSEPAPVSSSVSKVNALDALRPHP